MRVSILALAATLALGGGAHASDPHAPAPAATPTPSATPDADADAAAGDEAPAAPVVRLPGFAAELAQRPPVQGIGDWKIIADSDAWRALALAPRERRQSVRWDYASSLIARERYAEAMGVLAVMAEDDPDLPLVAAFQLAEGAVLTGLNRSQQAMAMLSSPLLATNAEACAWRVRAYAQARMDAEALDQVACALPAINGREPQARVPFILAAADAAIAAGQAGRAQPWLDLLPDRDPAANLLRGRALVAMGQDQFARLRLARAQKSGNAEQQAEAAEALVEAGVQARTLSPADGLKQLDALRYSWRGGPVEERALRFSLKLASARNDLRGQLVAGATLLRYFDIGRDAGPITAQLQAALGAALAPDSKLPLVEAAGLYWDYRELSPGGGEGDLLVRQLAARLEAAGLYARAAELLDYQLANRTKDVAQGPLSVKVATLRILAGRPDLALQALRGSDDSNYTREMIWDRKRVESVALFQMGKPEAAMAALDGVPDAGLVRAEIQWKRNDWDGYVSATQGALPPARGLNEVGQAMVLRQAIALAMLGREDQLAALRARYEAAFKPLASAGVFDVLTRRMGNVDPATVTKAMAAIPAASPAGPIADLFDIDPKAVRGG